LPLNPAAISARPQRIILLLPFSTFSSMGAQRICDAMLPKLPRFFAVGLAQAAQVVSMFAVIYGVAQLVHGPLGARPGRGGRHPIVAGLAQRQRTPRPSAGGHCPGLAEPGWATLWTPSTRWVPAWRRSTWRRRPDQPSSLNPQQQEYPHHGS
jgi:hypothetical protein